MSVTYDWSPAINALIGIAQQRKYNDALGSLFGQPDTIPAQAAGQLSTPAPSVSLPGAAAPAPANPAMKGASPIQMQPMQVAGGPLSINTPAIAPQTTYNGPVADALGQDQTASLLPLLKSLGPQAGMQLLPQLLLKAQDRKQEIADKTLRTLTPQEAAAKGYRAGTVVQEDPFGNDRVAQASDTKSPEAIKQEVDLATIQAKIKAGAPLTAYERAQLAQAQAVQAEKVREFNITNPQIGGPGGAIDPAQVPPADKAMVQAMLDGRQAPPTSFALKSPYWQRLMQIANSIDPTFDQTQWSQRVATRKDMLGGGKSYQTLNAGNTAIQHLGHLNSQIGDVSGVQFPLVGNLVNSGLNAASQASGTPGVNSYNDTLGHLAEETTKFYRGTGGSESDIERNMSNLAPNLSAEQKRAGVANTVSLIYGKLAPMVEQYNKAMNTNYPTSHFLSAKAIQTIKSMGFDPDTGEKVQAPSQSGGGWSIKLKGQ